MKKVLVLNANSKKNEKSRTYKVLEAFKESYKQVNPSDFVEEVNLFDLDLVDIDPDVMDGFGAMQSGVEFENLPTHVQSKLGKRASTLKQFMEADKIVLATPMWNLGNPAIVKKWVDHIVVANETFKYTEQGPIGLVEDKSFLFIQSAGGVYDQATELNHGYQYVKAIMNFIGITNFESIYAYGMDSGLEKENLPKAMKQAIEVGKRF